MGYNSNPLRNWFKPKWRPSQGPWREKRWTLVKRVISRFTKRMAKRLKFWKAPKWTQQPATNSDLSKFGRWRLLRAGYWGAVCRLAYQRCFGVNYGRAAQAVTVIAAALSCVIVGGVLYAGIKYRSNSQANDLRAVYLESIGREDLNTASEAINSLRDLHPANVEYRYQQALLESRRGNQSRAQGLMDDLVTETSHPHAALWLLNHSFKLQEIKSWSAERRGRFQYLAQLGLKAADQQSLIAIKSLMANYLLAVGATSEALRYLTELSGQNATAALTAATVYQQSGQIDSAQEYAEMAQRQFERELNLTPADSKLRLNLARSLIIQGHEDQALRSLSGGFELTQDPLLRAASAEAMVIWAERLGDIAEQTESTFIQRLQLLHRASQCAPQDPQVNAAMIQLLLESRDNQNSEVAALRQAAAKGIDPESLHFARGTLALLEGRSTEAEIHLKQAAKHGTQLPVTLNNLAMAIYHQPTGDLEQALALADGAISQLPDHPYLHDTRGRILLRLGRFEEAIGSLEKGLAAPELQASLYANLATAYRKLGDESMARDMDRLLAATSIETDQQK